MICRAVCQLLPQNKIILRVRLSQVMTQKEHLIKSIIDNFHLKRGNAIDVRVACFGTKYGEMELKVTDGRGRKVFLQFPSLYYILNKVLSFIFHFCVVKRICMGILERNVKILLASSQITNPKLDTKGNCFKYTP